VLRLWEEGTPCCRVADPNDVRLPDTAAPPRAEIKMLIDGADPFATAKPNVRLIRRVVSTPRLVGSDGITGKNPKAFPPFPLPSSEARLSS